MKRVMCIMTDGFEELEAVGTIALLRRAGIHVDVYTLHGTSATGRFELTLVNLNNLETINLDTYDALFLPGGPHYRELEKSEVVRSIIQRFANTKKVIAAICAAPTILGRMGLLKGKKYTCFTSMNENYQGIYLDQYAVEDGTLITGRSVAAVIDFSFLLIKQLMGKEKEQEVKNAIYYEE